MINKKRLIILYTLYFIALMWIILGRMNISEFCGKYRGVVLTPFTDEYFYTSKFAHDVCIIGNVLLFIPIGIYLPLFFREKKTFIRIVLSLLCIVFASLFLETMQYILEIGTSSSTDLIHNSLGGIIGVFIYEVLKRFVSNKIIDLINKWCIFILIFIDIFAIINTIINIKLYL